MKFKLKAIKQDYNQFLSNVLKSSLFFAIFPALIISIILAKNISRYQFDVIEKPKDITTPMYFADLESDGEKERYHHFPNPDGTAAILIHNDEFKMTGQYNFSHPITTFPEADGPMIADVDGDRIKDIIIFTQEKDSIFLNVLSYSRSEILINGRYIVKIGGLNDKKDYQIRWLGSARKDGNVGETLYFSVSGGFALTPRRVFSYTYDSDEVIAAENTGAAMLMGGVFRDKEDILVLVEGNASGNYKSDYDIPYPDSCCWIIGYDQNLNYAFDPIPIGKHTSHLSKPYKYGDYYYFAHRSKNNKGDNSKIIRINAKGAFEELDIFNHTLINVLYESIQEEGELKFHTLYQRYCMHLNPDEFSVKEKARQKDLWGSIPSFAGDIDESGDLEFIFFSNDGDISLYKRRGKGYKKIQKLISDQSHIWNITYDYSSEDNYGQMIIKTNDRNIVFSYSKNHNHYLGFLIYFLDYIIFVLFIYMILSIQRKRIQAQSNLKAQITDLQLRNINNQLDPHFAFNALTTIGNAIYQEDKDQAYNLFQKFSSILRYSLKDTQEVFRDLEEELNFTIDFLELQLSRFEDLFEYNLEVDASIEVANVRIPKMLIQNFAENAVKHAFQDIDYLGKIEIKCSLDVDNNVCIHISDNGIGIDKSIENGMTSGTKLGNRLIERQIEMINHLYRLDIKLSINDRSNIDPHSSGTTISIALNYAANANVLSRKTNHD